MGQHVFGPRGRITWEGHLLGLSALLSALCVLYIWLHPHPYSISVPEVLLPLGVSLALAAYTLRLKRATVTTTTHRGRLMAKYAWAGVLFSVVLGGGELLLHLYSGLPVDVFPDKMLSVVSVGVATGVLAGRAATAWDAGVGESARDRVVSEASWANRSDPNPILGATVEALAELEGCDPDELEPLYTHVDPGVFADLREHEGEGTPWQFTWFTDDHEIRISSHGTVTVFELDP